MSASGSTPFLDALKAGGGLNPDGTPTDSGLGKAAKGAQPIDVPTEGISKDLQAVMHPMDTMGKIITDFQNPYQSLKNSFNTNLDAIQTTWQKAVGAMQGSATDAASGVLNTGFADVSTAGDAISSAVVDDAAISAGVDSAGTGAAIAGGADAAAGAGAADSLSSLLVLA